MKRQEFVVLLLLTLSILAIAWKGQVAPTWTVRLMDISGEGLQTGGVIKMQWVDCPGPAEPTAGGKIYIPRPNGGSMLRDICPLLGYDSIKNP